MYTVYKITNLINNKCYIGSSINVERRWREHKNNAFNLNSRAYNYPLYRAFRKYGLENFKFEIINDDFETVIEMQQYEYQMICYYNSYQNGYNQTLNTTSPPIENLFKYCQNIKKRCARVDNKNNILEIFSSYHEAARACFSQGTAANRVRNICKGKVRSDSGYIFRDLDEQDNVIIPQFKTRPRRKPLICISLKNPEQEIYYNSILEAANDLTKGDRREIQLHLQGSVRFSSIHGYLLRELDDNGDIIDNGISIDEKIKEYNRLNPEINGERHSITEWCKIYNISRQSYYYRIKQGYDIVTALTMGKRK